MKKELIQVFKKKLEERKKILTKELQGFAKKDRKLEGDWDTKFPQYGQEPGSGGLERAADQVEDYTNLLAVEYSLEVELQKVNLALEKIKKRKYGICEKCGKKISKDRLDARPEAELCINCQKKES